ncbi:hypothetical protein MLD38_033343 [Melastoma candidum]|uniref:Uncharacterized protein n=1 Tax=Melastoma candidum TaxID=119954 RepID=A0ACB9M681_9MYRT|nr:hypothetical protein MLD38_033343 [Melastoma candidum]
MDSTDLFTLSKPVPGKTVGCPESVELLGDQETLLDTFFEFLDGSVASPGPPSFPVVKEYDGGEDYGEEEPCDAEKKREFWESQQQLLQATLCRTSSIETRIRQATKGFLRELESGDLKCSCGKQSLRGCRSCLLREVHDRLQREGFDCVIRRSKWRSSSGIPSGEHTYLEVLDGSNPKRATVRVIVELNFRAEFEMAKASEEYNRLIGMLPTVFVGKAERLRALIKIICSASKRCMKDRNIHMGPWRKHKYMQAKWLGSVHDGSAGELPSLASDRQMPKQRASMLTYDLVDSIPGIQCRTAVRVV